MPNSSIRLFMFFTYYFISEANNKFYPSSIWQKHVLIKFYGVQTNLLYIFIFFFLSCHFIIINYFQLMKEFG